MTDLNPISAWKRLLAQPNESRAKTIVVAFLLSAVCAVLVTAATVYLRPHPNAEPRGRRAAWSGSAAVVYPRHGRYRSRRRRQRTDSVIVNLEKGRAAEGLTTQALQDALDDPQNWTQLAPEQDTAGIGARPDIAQIFILRQDDRISLLILPILGSGYNGPIRAMLALRGDMNTIAGLTITDQSETPGLGARIEEAEWQSQFAGKQIADDKGTLRFSVARASANTEYEVDGITGATRTSNAITRMVRFWVGPEGYGPLIDAVRRGEF